MSIQEVHLIHHSHYDIGYTHPQPILQNLTSRFIDDAIELCEMTADYPVEAQARWLCEVTMPVMNWLKTAAPGQTGRFRKLVQQGRISIGAMPYHVTALHNLNDLTEGLQAVKYLRETLGATMDFAVQHDVNGLPWPIVGVLKDMGIDHLFMGINVHFGGAPFARPGCFDWQGPCGKTLTTWNGLHYNTFNRETGRVHGETRLDAMVEKFACFLNTLESQGYPHDFIMLTATHPDFDDNNAPDFELPEIIRAWNDAGHRPRLRFSSPQMVAEKLAALDTRPVHQGDWSDYWTFGVGCSAVETSVARMARAKTEAADRLQVLANNHAPGTRREAVHHQHLYQEHTFGSWAAAGAFFAPKDIEPIPVREQTDQKSNFAWVAHSHATMYLRDALECTASNPKRARGCQGLMLYNPSETAVHKPLFIPNELTGGQWPHFSSTIHRLDISRWFLTDETATWMDVGELPPNSITFIPIDQLKTSLTADHVTADETQLETAYYQLQYDGRSGRVTSLTDKASGQQLIDRDSSYEFFGGIQESIAQPSGWAVESGDIRQTFSEFHFDRVHAGDDCWNPDWQARRRGPSALLSISVHTDPAGAHLTRAYDMPGFVSFRQTITLAADKAAVECSLYAVKTENSEPEGIYLMFPLDIENPIVTFESAGQAVVYDKEQLPGSCRDHIVADSWIACHNDSQSIVLSCPDAPLFQIGGFTFARHLQSAVPQEKALLLGWPMNNYWNTNFKVSQPGPIRLRYTLTSSPKLDPAKATREAREQTIHYHPVVSNIDQARTETIVHLEGENLSLLHLGPHPEGGGKFICRVINHGKQASTAILTVPQLTIRRACFANPLNDPGDEIPVQTDGSLTFVTSPAGLTQCIIHTQP
ncbi:MAG: hypothetical protein H7A51_15035 [Akkermansiaceae bacterium]|nr:hypothetical protein [Akkermansiaceae bacterium]